MPTPGHLRAGAARGFVQLALGLALTSCNLEVPSSEYLRETTLIAVIVEVVELGPLNPDRVGVPSETPIAEPMPFDRVAFEVYVVNRDGERLGADELDSLWFQCGTFSCGEGLVEPSSELFDTDCDELGLGFTMDAVCRLGSGDGRFEFTVPQLGQLLIEQRVAQYYGVIAWEGRSASSCWEARRSRTESLDRCGFIQRSVKVGPSWWMLAYAETPEVGLISPVPVPEIPIAVYGQAANRVPVMEFEVSVDGELRGSWPEQLTFSAAPGSKIRIDPNYDENTQFQQTYFIATQPEGPESPNYLFLPSTELLGQRPFSSNDIVWIEPQSESGIFLEIDAWQFAVDEYAEPGTSRVLLYYFDDRYGEGVANFVFEVTG